MTHYKKILFETTASGHLIYLNRAFDALAFKVYPKTLQDLFHPEMPVKVIEQIHEAMQASQPWKSHIMLAQNDAGFEWGELFVADSESKMIGYLLPTVEPAPLSIKMQFACLKSFERTKRMPHHIEVENLALKRA